MVQAKLKELEQGFLLTGLWSVIIDEVITPMQKELFPSGKYSTELALKLAIKYTSICTISEDC
jgi:hypothetical protein